MPGGVEGARTKEETDSELPRCVDEQQLLLRLDLPGEERAMMVPLGEPAIYVLHKVSALGAE